MSEDHERPVNLGQVYNKAEPTMSEPVTVNESSGIFESNDGCDVFSCCMGMGPLVFKTYEHSILTTDRYLAEKGGVTDNFESTNLYS